MKNRQTLDIFTGEEKSEIIHDIYINYPKLVNSTIIISIIFYEYKTGIVFKTLGSTLLYDLGFTSNR